MYLDRATTARRCRGTNRDGSSCRGFACWGDTHCHRQGGHRIVDKQPVCLCCAYAWPHRPGGGLCRWPDAPLYRRTTRAGTHSSSRQTRGAMAEAMARIFGPGRPAGLESYWFGFDEFGVHEDE